MKEQGIIKRKGREDEQSRKDSTLCLQKIQKNTTNTPLGRSKRKEKRVNKEQKLPLLAFSMMPIEISLEYFISAALRNLKKI